MVTVNSRKYNVQFVMKAMMLTIAVCKQRRTCKICKQSHPAGLHGYLPKKKQPKVTSDYRDGVPPVDDKKLMTSNFPDMDLN